MVNTLNKEDKVGLSLEHHYSPRGACKEIFSAKDDEVLISGPAGTGKSRACLEKLHLMCLMTPHVRGLIVRKTLSSLASTALVTWRNYVAKEAIATGDVVYYGGSAEEPPQYRYSNGSSITIGGLDKPSRIMSSEYDIVYVQEATELTLEDIEMVNTRLRNWTISFQQLLMDCNPASEQHSLKLRCNEGKTVLFESRHEDNPVLFDENGELTEKGRVYIGKLDKLTGVRKLRLRFGLWVSSEGVIYDNYDPAVHLLQWEYENDIRLELPHEWPRYWVIDFGFVNPFVCQWWAEDPDGRLYMYREIYMTRRTVEEHARTILDCVTEQTTFEWYDHFNRTMQSRIDIKWTEPKPAAIITDHDAEDRRTLEKHLGMGTTPAIKAVKVGIDLSYERFKLDELGYSGIYIMEDTLVERDENLANDLLPTCTKEELTSYSWKIGTDGRKKEEPNKKDDHGCDDIRYIVMHRDFKGKARLREVAF